MIEPLAAVVLIVSALFISIALLGLLGRGDRIRLSASRVAMVGFASFGAFCFWREVQLRQSAGPVYYELAASPGPHRLILFKPGLSPGYRVQLVRRADRTFDKDLSAQLSPCQWRVLKCEKLALTRHTFDADGVMEFDSEYSDVVLEYDATPEVRSLLEGTAIAVRCPAAFEKPMENGQASLNRWMAFFLSGLVLAGLGVSVQRRKLRAAGLTGPKVQPPPPPAAM